MTKPVSLWSLWHEDRLLSDGDFHLASDILVGAVGRLADLVIAPDGKPYLYRWHVIPRNTRANVYLHIQVASDPERPLHDHPWDNQSVILSGGYDELVPIAPAWGGDTVALRRFKGQVIPRKATDLHRLLLPAGVPYAMTLFTTGPVVREWGFLMPSGAWANHRDIEETVGAVSTWKKDIGQ